MFTFVYLLLGLCQLSCAVFLNWNITWVNDAAPDGVNRPVIGVNGKWPPPILEAQVGEQVTIVVWNKLGNQSTSLHWHGIRQFQTNSMDGATGVTQCPIPPDSSFTYSFVASEAGTFWYHSHNMGQYPDGLRGAFVVHDPEPPWKGQVEKEYTITLSDWYHKQMPELISQFHSSGNGVEPVPDSFLLNDGKDASYPVEAGKGYLFRILNIGAFPSFFFSIEDHDFQIVEIDGVYTVPTTASTLLVGAAMRYSILVLAKTNTTKNFDITAVADASMFQAAFTGKSLVASGSLQYDANGTKATARTDAAALVNWGNPGSLPPPIDDVGILPSDNQPILEPVDHTIRLDFNQKVINGVTRDTINDVTYLMPKVPSLYTALSVEPEDAKDYRIYGANVNPIVINHNQIIEIQLNNRNPGAHSGHPWHLHGHQFQVVARSGDGVNATYAGNATLPAIPMRRDVAGVRPGGYLVIRFRADNPGINLFHCHIEWHVQSGLTATFIEAPDEIEFEVPQDHLDVCIAQGIPVEGNAAGNVDDIYDLRGANVDVPSVDNGAMWQGNQTVVKRARKVRVAPSRRSD
ncbi:putative exopolygalacturonase X [Venturia nashicola]|nr:putative exopolygalacturonase X [Venturia nashicola]